MRPASVGAIGQDRLLGAHRAGIRGQRDRPHRVVDPAHGRRQDHVAAQPVRQLDRHALRPADEAAVLRAAAGVDEHVQAAGRVDVEEHVQQRDVLGLRRPDGLGEELDHRPPRARAHVVLEPGMGGHPVPLAGARCGPRRVQRHRPWPSRPAASARARRPTARAGSCAGSCPCSGAGDRPTRARSRPRRRWGTCPRPSRRSARPSGPGSGRSTGRRPPRPCRRRCPR